jgi:bifunctional UDP-N-acetylglucosamine pyrophosphorylase/glucosamine-1-phosphate N-acetyltransferase
MIQRWELAKPWTEVLGMPLHAVVLAAGLGKRMKSGRHKTVHPVCGKPMILYAMDLIERLAADRTVVVVGHEAEQVRRIVGARAAFALQEEQLGTGHAVLQAEPLIGGEDGTTLVLYADMPLLTDDTVRRLVDTHRRSGAAVTVLSAVVDDPTGYGRIVRDASGRLAAIVEEKDCSESERAVREINTGVYCFDNRKLFAALRRVTNRNAQGEYYLTDVIGILRGDGETAEVVTAADPAEAAGVNDRIGLAEAEALMRRRINRRHMLEGVTLIDPETTYIEADVRIGRDTVIWPGCVLRGRTVIGEECEIGPQADIADSVVGRGSKVIRSVLAEAETGENVSIGPFAYLRPGTKLAAGVKVGDFVEIKNASVGTGSKVPHLSYVGDAEIGAGVNIGCGVITANYDGVAKHRTVIGDGAFIGSNSNLIAPVTVGRNAYVVAGSTITSDVGDDDLAIARSRQVNKPGYAKVLRARIQAKNKKTE